MNIKDIKSVQRVTDVANVPDTSSSDIRSEVDDTELYELVNRYYDERSTLNPLSYVLRSGDEAHTVRSTLGVPDDGLPIDEVTAEKMSYSHFSANSLEVAGIDIDGSWNGDMAGVLYNNGELIVINSDYYTTSIFGHLPIVELANVLRDSSTVEGADLDRLTMRNRYLNDHSDMSHPDWLASKGSIGGVVIAYTGKDWRVILGRRSDRTNINPGRLSMIPNGAIQYDNVKDHSLERDLTLGLSEEMFRQKVDDHFFEEFVDGELVSSGWDLSKGELALGYALVIDDPEGYRQLKKEKSHNFEFDEIVEVKINNYDRITNICGLDNMSPTVPPILLNSLQHLENRSDDIDLPYSVEEQ